MTETLGVADDEEQQMIRRVNTPALQLALIAVMHVSGLQQKDVAKATGIAGPVISQFLVHAKPLSAPATLSMMTFLGLVDRRVYGPPAPPPAAAAETAAAA